MRRRKDSVFTYLRVLRRLLLAAARHVSLESVVFFLDRLAMNFAEVMASRDS